MMRCMMSEALQGLQSERAGVRNKAKYLRAEIHSLDRNAKNPRAHATSQQLQIRLKELERRDRELTTQIAGLGGATG